MTATCVSHFLKNGGLDYTDVRGSNGNRSCCHSKDVLVNSCRGILQHSDCMDTAHEMDPIHHYETSRNRQMSGSFPTYRVVSTVKAVENEPIKAVKRRSPPFGIDVKPPYYKRMRLDSHLVMRNVNTTSELDDRNAEDGTFSGIPSPVVEDRANNSISPDIPIELEETPSHNTYFSLYQYGKYPTTPNGEVYGNGNTFYDTESDVCDVINSCLLYNNKSSTESHDIVQDRNNEQCINECANHKATKLLHSCTHCHSNPDSFFGDSKSSFTPCENEYINKNGFIINSNICHINKSITGSGMERACKDETRNALPLSGNINKFVSKKWRGMLKAFQRFLLILRPNLTISYVTSNVTEYLGYHQDQMMGRPLTDFIDGDHYPLINLFTSDRHPSNKGERATPLPLHHSFPVDMRFQFHTSVDGSEVTGYRTVKWYVRLLSANGADGHFDGHFDGTTAESLVCICCPEIGTSLIPNQIETRVLRGQPGWNLYHCLISYVLSRAFTPFGIDAHGLMTSFMTTPVPNYFWQKTYKTALSSVNGNTVSAERGNCTCQCSRCLAYCRIVDRKNLIKNLLKCKNMLKDKKIMEASKGINSLMALYSIIIKLDMADNCCLFHNNRHQRPTINLHKTLHPCHKSKQFAADAKFLQQTSSMNLDQERIKSIHKTEINCSSSEGPRQQKKLLLHPHTTISSEESTCKGGMAKATKLTHSNAASSSFDNSSTNFLNLMNTKLFETLTSGQIDSSTNCRNLSACTSNFSLKCQKQIPESPHELPLQGIHSPDPSKYSSLFGLLENKVDLLVESNSNNIQQNCPVSRDAESRIAIQSSLAMSQFSTLCQKSTDQQQDYGFSSTQPYDYTENFLTSKSHCLEESMGTKLETNSMTPQYQSSLYEGSILQGNCDPSIYSQNISNKNAPQSNYLSTISNNDVNLQELDELDLTSEFHFHANDVVMPVERELDCDLVPDKTSSNATDFAGDNEGNLDTFSSQYSNDFMCSFENDIQVQDFEPFDNLLSFSTASFTPSSDNFTNNISVNASSDRNLQFKECSNELLIEMDNVVPENKNPFETNARSFNESQAPCSLFNSFKESSMSSTQRTINGKRSLLRSLLKKDELEEQTSPPIEWKMKQLQKSSQSSKLLKPNTFTKLLNPTQTKELPVPKIQSSKKTHYHLHTTPQTRELPLPSYVVNTTINSQLSPLTSCKSANSYESEEPDNIEFVEVISNSSKSLENNILKNLNEEDGICDANAVLSDSDTLPDDVIDLAMEYCNSMHSQQTENLITELKDHLGWEEALNKLNSSNFESCSNRASPPQEICSLHQNLNSKSMTHQVQSSNHILKSLRGKSASSVCLPTAGKAAAKTNFKLISRSNHTSSPSNSMKNQVSLLRQAITSPDVDKFINQIPLGRRLLHGKNKACFENKHGNNNGRHLNTDSRVTHNELQNSLQSLDANKSQNKLLQDSEYARYSFQRRQCTGNSSKVSDADKPYKTAVSHISISAPPKKILNTKNNVSPMKVTISASRDINKQKSSPLKTDSSSQIKTNKMTSCQNSSSEPVSVMVMRKENHRSRRNKTIATQTENKPDEIYPELELSPTDVILTPSIYFDISHSSQSSKSPSAGAKSTPSLCNVFSSSLRSLVSPRDSKELAAHSPCPSQASLSSSSSSSISELEMHLRGLNSPNGNISSSIACESEASSDTPFLQRLLTGELNKDKYEKLDKDLLERQKSDSLFDS